MAQTIRLPEVDNVRVSTVMDNNIDVLMAGTKWHIAGSEARTRSSASSPSPSTVSRS